MPLNADRSPQPEPTDLCGSIPRSSHPDNFQPKNSSARGMASSGNDLHPVICCSAGLRHLLPYRNCSKQGSKKR
ncbi:MAG TPA: hypothetical protein V6D10_01580 [Trichocoleus sp.]